MINRDHKLPLTRQAELLNISRGALYYKSRNVSAADLNIMRRLDALHLDYPITGSRMLRDMLVYAGASIGDRKSTRLNSSHTDISRMPSSA